MCNAIGGRRRNVSTISNCSLLDDNRCIFNPSLKIERSSFQNKLHRRFGFHKGGGRGIHLSGTKKKKINQKFHLPFLSLSVYFVGIKKTGEQQGGSRKERSMKRCKSQKMEIQISWNGTKNYYICKDTRQ